jgi:hypothetical protein
VDTSTKICRQFTTALGLTYRLNNYVHDYTIECDYGLLIQFDKAMTADFSNLDLRGFELSSVSSLFDLWSLSDSLSRVYPYPLPIIEKVKDSVYLQSLIRESNTCYLNRESVEGCGHSEIKI